MFFQIRDFRGQFTVPVSLAAVFRIVFVLNVCASMLYKFIKLQLLSTFEHIRRSESS